jgi:tRNA threonylcarbamoyl adenosine modification protein (Sua5/YciO/YrdC/YwlC family)
MLLKLYEENPNPKIMRQLNECLLDGGVIIYPTDTLYGFGCNIFKPKAIERIAKIKNIEVSKNTFSIICHSISQIADYAKPIDNHYFKIIKRCLPGPFTFILEANNKIPKHLHRKNKHVGLRIPDNNIVSELIHNLGNPLMSSSIPIINNEIEYSTDPELIYEKYSNMVDFVIDAGYGELEPSTIVDLTGNEYEIIREGKGDIELL